MAINYKYANISDNISEQEFIEFDKDGKKKASVRPILLSKSTINRRELINRITEKHPGCRTQMQWTLDLLIEGITDALKEGHRIHIEEFGQFSLNGQFKKNSMAKLDSTSRANSIEIKNVLFQADKKMKEEIGLAGFERYNPEKHGVRKYD